MSKDQKEKNGLPTYITEGADGSYTVDLVRGLEIAGTKVTKLKLREPSLEDQLASQQAGGSADTEIALIANLAEISPTDLHSAKMRDYARLQKALDFFYG
ncbi:phage tail assembly protein [Sulfitobacter sp. OXR-159]|uniref:phage tail assembly protein n=1 Tax=Sulfitobacter sp. OXR-159 TaxID=3100174 RepID=UPI002AC9197B|nr:phage tail assembly protein [Sulfitobacter sp. OXR-159]WPZ28984.1 phage tail assembly protein [Sulfitobacter sp. OXR-159]